MIDLSMILPGFIISGVAALQSREHGLFWLAPWLVFSVLMGSSIIAAMVLMMAAGHADTVPATVIVSVVVAASLLAVRGFLTRASHPPRRNAATPGPEASSPGGRPVGRQHRTSQPGATRSRSHMAERPALR